VNSGEKGCHKRPSHPGVAVTGGQYRVFGRSPRPFEPRACARVVQWGELVDQRRKPFFGSNGSKNMSRRITIGIRRAPLRGEATDLRRSRVAGCNRVAPPRPPVPAPAARPLNSQGNARTCGRAQRPRSGGHATPSQARLLDEPGECSRYERTCARACVPAFGARALWA